MVSADDLRQIFCPEYILDAANSVVVKEKQDNADALAELEFTYSGHITLIKQDVLDSTKEAYRKQYCPTLLLKKICDGVLLLDGTDGSHYIIYLEMKSGFSDVRKKAILQIPPSYLKINTLLKGFTSFNKSLYKELGVIVSYPPAADSANYKVMSRKKGFVGPLSNEDKCRNKYINKIRTAGMAVFEGCDFGMDTLKNICPEMLFRELLVVHNAVPDKCVKAKVDLDGIIRRVYP